MRSVDALEKGPIARGGWGEDDRGPREAIEAPVRHEKPRVRGAAQAGCERGRRPGAHDQYPGLHREDAPVKSRRAQREDAFTSMEP